MLVDEVWKYCSPTAIPQELANCIQPGRIRNLEMMFATQRPNRLNETITNEVTELVCFRLQGVNALKRVADLGAPWKKWSHSRPALSWRSTWTRAANCAAACSNGSSRRRGFHRACR